MSKGEIKITYAELGLGVLVVVLSVLLVISYLSGNKCAEQPDNTTGAVIATQQVPQQVQDKAAGQEMAGQDEVQEPATDKLTPPKPSCDDGLLNQDETDVDCGGSCPACDDGEACIVDTDCVSKDCLGGTCQAAPQLSGEVTFSLGDVETKEAASGAVKVTSVTVSVENGLEETGEYEVRLFLKSDDNYYYLNQNKNALEREKYDPYAVIELAPIPSGETLSLSYDLDGLYTASSYVYSLEPGVYENGDDFRVEAQLVDSVTGEVIKQAQRRVKT